MVHQQRRPPEPNRTAHRRVHGIPSGARHQPTGQPRASWHAVPDRRPRRCPRPPASRPPGSVATTTPPRPRRSRASTVSGRTSRPLPCRTTRFASSHWSPPPGTTTTGTPAISVLDSIPPAAADHQVGAGEAVRPAAEADRRPGRHRQRVAGDPGPPPGSGGQRHTGLNSSATSASPAVPVVAVDGATTITGPSPPVSPAPRWSVRNAAARRRRPRPASPVRAPPAPAAWRSAGAPDRDPGPAARSRRGRRRAAAVPPPTGR